MTILCKHVDRLGLHQSRLGVKKSTVDDDNNNLQCHIKQLVLPRVMRSSILQAYHDFLLGHCYTM